MDRADAAALRARARPDDARGCATRAITVLDPAATYFLCVDLRRPGIDVDDETLPAAAVEQAGVATVPLSAFAESNPPRHLVRLCFAKNETKRSTRASPRWRKREGVFA